MGLVLRCFDCCTGSFAGRFLWVGAAIAVALALIPRMEAGGNIVGVFPVPLLGGTDNLVSVPLERAAVFQGRIETVNWTFLYPEADPGWTPSQWAGFGETGEYFACVVQTGTLAGSWYPILYNSADSLLISPEQDAMDRLAAELTGSIVKIVPYWTPDSLFAHTRVPNRTLLYVPAPETPGGNGPAEEVLSFFEGYGWFHADFSPAGDFALRRGDGVRVRLPSGAETVSLEVIGQVPQTPFRRVWRMAYQQTTEIFVGPSVPEPVLLKDFAHAVPDRTLLYYWSAGSGINRSPAGVLTYFRPYGWYDPYFNRVDDTFGLKPGAAYLIRLGKTASFLGWEWGYRPKYLDLYFD